MHIKRLKNSLPIIGAVLFGLNIHVSVALAQQSTSIQPEVATASPGTNPTQRIIVPKNDQTEAQQLSDQLECYEWTCGELDWDPYQRYDALVSAGYAVALDPEEMERGLICLAMEGAVAGAVVGEVVPGHDNSAELGAAIGITSGLIQWSYLLEPDDPQAQRTVTRFERSLEKWERKFSGCMRRNGYRVLSE